MSTSKWVSVDTSRIVPPSVAEMPAVVQSVTELVNGLVEATAQLAELVDTVAAPVMDPKAATARALLAELRAALHTLTGVGAAGLHFLEVPLVRIDGIPQAPVLPVGTTLGNLDLSIMLGSGGNLGFYNTVSNSLRDRADTARPNYGMNDYVAGLVLLAGSARFNGVVDALHAISCITGALGAGLDAHTLPSPRDLKVTLVPLPKAGLPLAVNLTWTPDPPVGRTQYGIAGFNIRNVVVYRSEHAFDFTAPKARLDRLLIARLPYDLVRLSYVDTTVEPDKRYFYAVGYEMDVVDMYGTVTPIARVPICSAAQIRVQAPPSRTEMHVAFARGAPPDWAALTTTLELFPKLNLLLTTIGAYTASIEQGLANTSSALQQMVNALRAVAIRRAALVAALIEILDDVKSLFAPVEGVYAMTFAAQGGNDAFLREVYGALTNTTDIMRPPFDSGKELVGGVVLLAGSGTERDLEPVKTLLSWITGAASTPFDALAAQVNTPVADLTFPKSQYSLCPNARLV